MKLKFFIATVLILGHIQNVLANNLFSYKNEDGYKRIYHFESQALTDIIKTSQPELQFPLPNGKHLTLTLKQNEVLPTVLQEKYPEIKSYDGVANNQPNVTAKVTIGNNKIHADIFDGERHTIIQATNNETYEVFYKDEATPINNFICGVVHDKATDLDQQVQLLGGILSGTQLKTYRLAISCTYEYSVAVTNTSSPTKAQVLTAIVTTLNRVNGIYQREMGVQFQLVPNNDTLIFTTISSGTFNNNDATVAISQNRSFINARVGSSNYDIGHVFTTGGGGLAAFQSICTNSGKAEGVTGTNQPYNDPFDVDYVAHEIGHQLGADHTFNRCDNEESIAAFEPGSGSTILAYAGICGSQNLQNNSDDYFHAFSKKQMNDWLLRASNATCGVTNTSALVIDSFKISETYHIPAGTAFELQAPNGLSADKYNWYQWNLGNLRSSQASSATILLGPTFRSYRSTTNKDRVFPKLDSILVNKYSYLGERIPTVSRNLHFVLELSKMSGAYGIHRTSDDTLVVRTYNTGAPFAITFPNSANTVVSKQIVTNIAWEKGLTDVAPISCSLVDIFLSSDGGKTISDTIALQVPNTGNYAYTFPDHLPNLTTYRIKIKCSNNIFFDITDNNFTLQNYLSVNEIQHNTLDANIYPNPVVNNLTIELKENATYTLQLSNAVGQQTYSETRKGNQFSIPTQHMNKGIYILSVVNKETGKALQQKIILQ